jgi:hypothetical protein
MWIIPGKQQPVLIETNLVLGKWWCPRTQGIRRKRLKPWEMVS